MKVRVSNLNKEFSAFHRISGHAGRFSLTNNISVLALQGTGFSCLIELLAPEESPRTINDLIFTVKEKSLKM